MGSAYALEDDVDTRYLHRLILIYQLISNDEPLKATLARHGTALPYPAPNQQYEALREGALDKWGPCSVCGAQLQAKACADVSALRKHVLLCDADPPVDAASPGGVAAKESSAAIAGAEQLGPPATQQLEESAEVPREGMQPPTIASTAPSTTEETQHQTEEGCGLRECYPEEVAVIPSSACAAEPLFLAYDHRTGTAVPHSPSGISSLSVGPPSSPLGPLGGRRIPRRGPTSKAGRIFVDGVFDLLHSGHFNALRQARQLGQSLVVGVNSDLETYAVKGCWPLYTQEERAEIVASCKWVDEVVVGTPYEVSTELLDALCCEAAAHGDDWVVGADGKDAYAKPRAAGRMVTFKRTEGISSTCITRRLLEATAHMCEERVAVDGPQSVGHFARQALQGSEAAMNEGNPQGREGSGKVMFGEARIEEPTSRGPRRQGEQAVQAEEGALGKGSLADNAASQIKMRQGDWSVFMSSKRLLQFIGEAKKPKSGDRVVYVDGSFDVLHVGHVRILKIAKEMGDYLIVGIHDDATVSAVKGPGFPVMNVNERALNVLAMRMVDEVIIGAPWKIPKYLLQIFGIHIVVRGTRIDCIADPLGAVLRGGHSTSAVSPAPCGTDTHVNGAGVTPGFGGEDDDDPYRVPKELGIYREVESFSSWTTKELVTRLIRNRQALSDSLRHREMKETHFWQSLRGQTARLAAEL